MSNTYKIRISRSKYIEPSRGAAILRLDMAQHFTGQPIMVRYYTESGSIDNVFAVGIADGTGRDCYRVVSLGGLTFIQGVTEELPDVSQLIHGEQYIWRNSEGAWCYVYLEGDHRQITPIDPESSLTLTSLGDGYTWYFRGGVLSRQDDFYSPEDISKTMHEIDMLCQPPLVEVESELGNMFEYGQVVDIPINIKVTRVNTGEDISGLCEFYVDGVKLEPNEEGRYILPEVSGDHDYKISAKYEVVENIYETYGEFRVRFGRHYYFGVVSETWEPTEENILGSESFLWTKNNKFIDGLNLNLQKVFIAIPGAYGKLIHIYDVHRNDYLTSYSIQSVNINGEGYNVYILGKAVTIKNFRQEFIFSETDDQTATGKTTLDSIEKAWDSQNMPGGVVVLDSEGKLYSHVLPGDLDGKPHVVELLGFITKYPTKGLVPGDRWFNTKTNKLFYVDGDGLGVISDPIEKDTIYVNLEQRLMYVWRNPEMVVVSGALDSEKITNLEDILL